MQDKVGPRLTAILGGMLVGAGFLICSQTSSYWDWILGFGGLAGAGFGFGYSATTWREQKSPAIAAGLFCIRKLEEIFIAGGVNLRRR